MGTDDEKSRSTIYLSDTIIDLAKEEAERQDTSFNQIVEQALKGFLANDDAPEDWFMRVRMAELDARAEALRQESSLLETITAE